MEYKIFKKYIFSISLMLFLFLFLSRTVGAIDINDPNGNKDMRMIWVGAQPSSLKLQFTDLQYDYIQQNHSILVIARFHGVYDLARHIEAAEEIKNRNSAVKVFVYYGANNHRNIINYGDTCCPTDAELEASGKDWRMTIPETDANEIFYLHTGGHCSTISDCTVAADKQYRIMRSSDKNQVEYYIDYSRPVARNWAVNLIKDLLNDTFVDNNGQTRAVFDGVAVDNAHLWDYAGCGADPAFSHCNMIRSLSSAKITAVNDGFKQFFTEIRANIPADKSISFNGVENEIWAVNSSKELLNYVDMAANEQFAIANNHFLTKAENLNYINTMKNNTASGFLMKTNSEHPAVAFGGVADDPDTPGQIAHIKRYGFGSFLLGYKPGKDFFKFSYGTYDIRDNVNKDPDEININFGSPTGDYSLNNYNDANSLVYRRNFARSIIYVNMEDTAQTIYIPVPLTRVNGGTLGTSYQQNDAYTIAAHDTAFFLKNSVLEDPAPGAPAGITIR